MTPPDFVDALVQDLEPVRPASPWLRTALVWFASSWLLLGGLMFATGPLREGLWSQLASSPGFALQLGLGISASLAAIAAGLELGVPGAPSGLRLGVPVALCFAAWTCVTAMGLLDPEPVASLSANRSRCPIQIVACALPPFVFALHLVRRRALSVSIAAGALIGLGAGAVPAWWMYLTCTADAMHVMTYHLSPLPVLGVLGAATAWALRTRP